MIEYFTSGDISLLQRQSLITLVCWGIMVAAVIIDLWTGIDKAKAKGEALHSRALRRTITKIGEYWRVLAMFLLFDIVASFIVAYTLPYGSMVGAICVIGIEACSVIENLREKRSSAAKIPDAIAKIIECNKIDEAKKLINIIKEL